MPKPNSVGCYRQLDSSSLYKQTRGTHSAEMCYYRITLRARHIPGCLNVMADFLSQMFKQICFKWFTPHVDHVDLFASHLNHKVPLYVSPVPDQHAWDIDALNRSWSGSHCICLPSHDSPSQGDPKNQAMQLPDHCTSSRLARDGT